MFPFRSSKKALVRPHAGHGIEVSFLNKHSGLKEKWNIIKRDIPIRMNKIPFLIRYFI